MSLKRAFIALFMFFALTYSFLTFKQAVYYRIAKDYEKKGNLIRAIDNYASVIYMHVPFSFYEKDSISSIEKIANIFSKKKNLLYELYAYEMLRSSIYGIRNFHTPYKAILKKIEPKIADLRVKISNLDLKKEDMLDIMQKDLSPDPFFSFISIFSFFLFCAAVLKGIICATEDNRFEIKRFFKFFIPSLFFWIIWIVFLYEA